MVWNIHGLRCGDHVEGHLALEREAPVVRGRMLEDRQNFWFNPAGLRGPSFQSWDIALFKNILLGGSRPLQLARGLAVVSRAAQNLLIIDRGDVGLVGLDNNWTFIIIGAAILVAGALDQWAHIVQGL